MVTLGPSTRCKEIISDIENEGIYLFRINLSHTPIESLGDAIREFQGYTDVPICLDSEGAQIRNLGMANGAAFLNEGDEIRIHPNEVLGDSNNISFSPAHVANQLRIGDEISIDFDSARIRVARKNERYWLARVLVGGMVGSNKAVDINRDIDLETITQKDQKAIEIGKKLGIRHYALSFAASMEDVNRVRRLVGKECQIISKIESLQGLLNLNSIIEASDEIIIDRGDLSRQIRTEKIPFLQRRIVAVARSKGVPVHVATNLLESMVKSRTPTRAEVNDVVSCLLMGANGLVLAGETAVGKYPVEAVRMTRRLIGQFARWTPNTSIVELLDGELRS